VEKKNPWPFVMAHVKAARDRGLVSNRDGEIKCVLRTQGDIPAGIEDVSQSGGLVKGRIIDHELIAPSFTKSFARNGDKK
jgi:hypothetical protein